MCRKLELKILEIFADFIDRDFWVGWIYLMRDGKRTKVPISAPTGRAASCSNPSTWGSYREVQRMARKAGIGLVLTLVKDDIFLIGIDIDTCRDPKTGELTRWAKRILKRLPSYAEISPSLMGLKIFALMSGDEWCKARGLLGRTSVGEPKLGGSWKGEGQNHPPGVELYLGGRYFTVTGRAYDNTQLEFITADDVDWLIKFCSKEFQRAEASTSYNGSKCKGRQDRTESGEAFNACVAAARAGIEKHAVPEWVADQLNSLGLPKFEVSANYWDRHRSEGTQLDRDYERARLVVKHQREEFWSAFPDSDGDN